MKNNSCQMISGYAIDLVHHLQEPKSRLVARRMKTPRTFLGLRLVSRTAELQ